MTAEIFFTVPEVGAKCLIKNVDWTRDDTTRFFLAQIGNVALFTLVVGV